MIDSRALNRGRRAQRRTPGRGLQFWARAHTQACASALNQLLLRPVSAALTVAVISIALALPAALYIALANLERVIEPWDAAAHISVFIRIDADRTEINALQQTLLELPAVAEIDFIPKEFALEDLRNHPEFGEALAFVEDNPLPDVLVVRPVEDITLQDTALESLRDQIAAQDLVDLAQLDTAWIRRLAAITEILRNCVILVAVMLGIGAALIVGNTIRLNIAQRREEIGIAKLVGATDSFVRRPYLYSGFWQGLIGAGLAWLLIKLGNMVLAPAVLRLADAYGVQFELQNLSIEASMLLFTLGALLGLCGAALAVSLYLRSADRAMES